MRVVHLVDGFDGHGGGVVTYLQGLFPLLAGAGVESIVVAGQSVPADLPGARCEQVPGIEADVPALPSATRAALEAALDRMQPDVCTVHVICPEVAAVAATRAPVVVHAHEYLTVCPGGSRHLERSRRFCSEGPGLRCVTRAYTERCTNRHPVRLRAALGRVAGWQETWPLVARVLVASAGVGEVLTASGAPGERIRVVPYPVEAAGRADAASTTASAPRRGVLSLGRLTGSKGVDVLLRAVTLLPGVELVVAGDGPERAALEALAQELGIAGRVRFLGWVGAAERDRLLAESAVLAVPSLWAEPFGIAGVEALAAGLPVVGSRIGGIPTWLDHGMAGLLVPPGDAVALARTLHRVLAEPGLAERLGGAAPASAARFAPARHLQLLLAELEAARAEGRRGA